MKELPKGEIYEMNTIQDIFNCPLNMTGVLLKAFRDLFEKRKKRYEETGKEHKILFSNLYVKNDGIDEIFLDFPPVSSNQK